MSTRNTLYHLLCGYTGDETPLCFLYNSSVPPVSKQNATLLSVEVDKTGHLSVVAQDIRAV